MASFKEIRESLVMGYIEDTVDDDEFLLFYDFYGSKNPNFPYASYPPFDLQDMEDSGCLAKFRVHKRGIPLPADALQIPPTFRYQKRAVCEGIEGLCRLQKKIYDKFKAFTDLEKRTGNFGL